MREYMARRYDRRKAAAIDQLGGKCVRCGTKDDLDFDHMDPATKSFTIARRLAGVSEAKLQAELAKCQLLCGPCHLEKSRSEGSLSGNDKTYRCCGRTFIGSKAYGGHRRWCDTPASLA
jgi:5-methylcytosine-specific restriction endonuclease McrA